MYVERECMLLKKELIHECICGNRAAQKELYEKYSPFFFTICMRYMPTREDAEDVLVMGFTSIFANLDTYKGEGSFEGWMKKIIVNTAINTLRRDNSSRHYKIKDEYEELEQKGILKTKDEIYTKMDIKYIMKQIQELPTGKRMIFNLCVIDGIHYEDVADMLGISRGTVASQVAAARKILQKKLQDFK